MTGDTSREPAFARALRGFGPVGIIAILIILAGNLLIVPTSALLVLLWAKVSRTPWPELGFVRPRSWPRTIIIGIFFGVALKFFLKAVVMPLLGAPPINESFRWVTGNPAALPLMLYLIIVGAGFGEEVVYRGWMFERMGRIFGSSVPAKVAMVLLTAALFAAAHYPGQGIPGVEQAFIVALIFGALFAMTRQIFLLMIAHTAFDLIALAMIYWGWETAVSRFFFK